MTGQGLRQVPLVTYETNIYILKRSGQPHLEEKVHGGASRLMNVLLIQKYCSKEIDFVLILPCNYQYSSLPPPLLIARGPNDDVTVFLGENRGRRVVPSSTCFINMLDTLAISAPALAPCAFAYHLFPNLDFRSTSGWYTQSNASSARRHPSIASVVSNA